MLIWTVFPIVMLILASASPRRRDLLRAAGLEIETRIPDIDETPRPQEPPRDLVLRLAREKAYAVGRGTNEIILAADTVVVLGEEVLGKPASAGDARSMLSRLSGRDHVVATGVCLLASSGERQAVEQTRVWFSALTGDEIDAYAATGEPMDKAGAYAIQGLASRYITRIEGDYANVVGLPVARVYRLLREFPEWRDSVPKPSGP